MSSFFQAQAQDLRTLAEAARLRVLSPRTGIDFASNDYLGLAGSQRLRDAVAAALARGVSIGSGGSRLLRGNGAEHAALESEAAAWFGSEAALWFSTGYAANSALVSTLPQRGDLIVYDTLIHASVHEGLRLTRAERRGVPHNDAQAFDDAIVAWRAKGGTGRAWIAVESLYSMDGDKAPLDALAEIADRHEAILLIDEAHATGVFGAGGRGLAAHLEGRENVVTLRTCGKAMGCEGALVCGPRLVCDILVNRGRGFIFSTAPSPLMAAAVRESLRILADEPERPARLHALVREAETLLAPVGVEPTGSQILPLVLGEDARTMRVARAVQAGTARLRISLTLNATAADVAALAETLKGALA
jgi:8-amino-7-oxononanoate synthase